MSEYLKENNVYRLPAEWETQEAVWFAWTTRQDLWEGYLETVQSRFVELYLLCSDFQKFSISRSDNDIKEAEKLDKILQPVHNSMFIESNPSPVKYAAKLLNLCDDSVRLPLVKVTDPTKEIIKKVLQSAKII